MIVPQYWAEGRYQERREGRQITVRRFGWSDTSQEDAQSRADERARTAYERIAGGEKLDRRERKLPYNGADGVPIREEIVERDGETVITRNAYGARCLNTPNVLFADIDFSEGAPGKLYLGVFLVLLSLAAMAGWLTQSRAIGIGLAIAGLIFGGVLANLLHRTMQKAGGGEEQKARKRIGNFVERNPGWNLRLYRTPSGMRLLATHRTFDPLDPQVDEFFRATGTDPLYAKMCRNQQCFRARVSPKPWRIGIQEHMRPQPGVWPVAPESMAARREWIEKYESAAAQYASCSFVESLGSGLIHFDVRDVQEMHDELCKASSGLPIA